MCSLIEEDNSVIVSVMSCLLTDTATMTKQKKITNINTNREIEEAAGGLALNTTSGLSIEREN